MLLLGCLLALGAAFVPRLILVLAWLFGNRWDVVWRGNWIMPLLGIIFLPYTTIMYLLVWNAVTGIQGFDWVWLAFGVMLDIMKWSQIVRNRQGIPGQQKKVESEGYLKSTTPGPASQEEAHVNLSAAAVSDMSELDQLAALRDKGILTEEEYQAKKAKLEENLDQA
jgi:hypothetical protein